MSKDPQQGQSASALRLFRIEPGKRETLRMLSGAYGGLFTHWYRSKSVYCDGEHCLCPLKKEPRLWKGYTAAEVWLPGAGKWMPVTFEITEHTELDMRGVYERGQVWEFVRLPQAKGKRTPVMARLIDQLDPTKLPEPFDYRIPLYHVYHVTELDLAQSNPLPGRLLVEASDGAPPINSKPKERELSQEERMESLRILRDGMKAQGYIPNNGKK